MASTLPQPHQHQAITGRCNPHPLLHSRPLRLRAARLLLTPAPLRYWHLASFDAPTVAVVWTLAFAWAAHVHVAPATLALDVLVVWAVYVGDRLLDARRALQSHGEAMRDRHWFHWRHRRLMAPLAVAAFIAAACIALRSMPPVMWQRDSVVGLASLVYFARVHDGRPRAQLFSKEMLVGLLFTAGCALPALSWKIAAPAVLFAALAWLNCWSIECWESGAKRLAVEQTAIQLALLCLVASACFYPFQHRASLLLLAGACSAILLAALDRTRSRLTALMLRSLADLVLLTPAIALAAAKVAR